MSHKIGFIGLGIMGRGMAENLLDAGYELTVWNRTPGKADDLVAKGAKEALSASDAARGNDIVIAMLADPPAVRSAVLGEDGALMGMESGSVLIDCSTVDPATTKATYEAASDRGVKFIDSPVGGSKDAAAKGELLLMTGGDADVLENVRPVLDVVSKKIIHAGPTGSGTSLKLCYNLVVSHIMVALSEALVLGTASGIDPQSVIDSFMNGTVTSPFFEWKGGAILDRDFSTNFSVKLMHKDLNLMMSAGYDLNLSLPVTALVKEMFGMAKAKGMGDEDVCSVVKVLEESAGVVVRKSS